MKSFLRVCTSDIRLSSDHPSIPMVSRAGPSFGSVPRDTRTPNRCERDLVEHLKSTKSEDDLDASRTIRRTFAFDEWDEEEEAMPNDAIESTTSGYYKSKSKSKTIDDNPMEGNHDDAEDRVGDGDFEDGLHGAIRRSFAFDEWDDDEMGILVGHKDNKRGDTYKCPTPNEITSFLPIGSEYKGDDDSFVMKGHDDHTSTTTSDAAGIANGLKFSSLSSIPKTKFDLDNNKQQQHQQHTILVTPSPVSDDHRKHPIQRPNPVYSHQTTVEPVNLFSQPATTTSPTAPFSHESLEYLWSGTTNYYRPTDYKSLERLFEQQQQQLAQQQYYSDLSLSPPQCESIPRRASAFHNVNPYMVAGGNGVALVSPPPCMYHRSLDRNATLPPTPTGVDEKWSDRDRDRYESSGAAALLQVDFMFDSPTSTTSDDYSSISPAIPKFIMFYKTE